MSATRFAPFLPTLRAPLAVVLGTNEIASAVAVKLRKAHFSVILSHDPYPPVIRRGMAFYDALFEDVAIIHGVTGRARRNRDRNRRHRRRELRRRDAAAILRTARLAPHPRADRRPHAETLRHARTFAITSGWRWDSAPISPSARIATSRSKRCPSSAGALVAEGSTDDYDGESRRARRGRAGALHPAPSEGVWHTPFDIGARVARGQALGNLAGITMHAPMDGVLRGRRARRRFRPRGRETDRNRSARPARAMDRPGYARPPRSPTRRLLAIRDAQKRRKRAPRFAQTPLLNRIRRMTPQIPRAELERLLFDDAPLWRPHHRNARHRRATRPDDFFGAQRHGRGADGGGGGDPRDGRARRSSFASRTARRLAPGAEILRASGPAGALLRGWKVAQTLVEIWSGVATAARDIVEAARAAAPDICVACTRKNTPGVKSFAVAAVKAGGAVMHRLGLSETILVFPEHRAFLAANRSTDIATRLRRAAPEKKLVIEVGGVADGVAAAQAGFDVIQAEKFSSRRHRRTGRADRRAGATAGRRGRRRRQPRQCAGIRAGRRAHSRDIRALFRGAARCFRPHFRPVKATFRCIRIF